MRNWLRRSLVVVTSSLCLGGAGMAHAVVDVVGTPMAMETFRGWEGVFSNATGLDSSYVEAMEEVSSAELFAGLYDMAVIEFPFADYRLKQNGLVQFPLLGIGIGVVVNLPGILPSDLRLNAAILAAIYMGKITTWDDSRIAELNPGIALPRLAIVPIAQSDGSIVTFNFTRYLAAGSEVWRRQIGLGSGLIWPLGKGEKDAVAAAKTIRATEGAIGFQPWNNVMRFNLAAVQLQNTQGVFIKPSPEAFAKTFRAFLALPPSDFAAPVNMKNADSWPIMAVFYGQMKQIPEDVPDALNGMQMLKSVLQEHVPTAPGFMSVMYQDIAPALSRVQTSKQFGPPVHKGGS